MTTPERNRAEAERFLPVTDRAPGAFLAFLSSVKVWKHQVRLTNALLDWRDLRGDR
jgi:hypothetical protein